MTSNHAARTGETALTHVHDARATLLARAFYDDPIHRWMIPEDSHRVGVYATCLDLLIAATETRGQVVASEDGTVIQLWHTAAEGAESGLLTEQDGEQMRDACGEYGHRADQLVAAMDRLHPAEPHQYLALIGTNPDQQGHGRGRAALESALAACDASGLPTYLEATSARSAALYRRLGFHDCPDPIPVVPSGPMLYPLWRPAAA